MERSRVLGRYVYPITSDAGQKDYYEHLNYWRVCYRNTNSLITPTKDEALDYLSLQAENGTSYFYLSDDKESRKKLRRLEIYNTRYDWRPRRFVEDRLVGLISPTGEQLLPNCFADVFTQFDAINNKPLFVPVSNGEGWALVSLTEPHVMITDFQYSAIIPERWGLRLFFVQDRETKKWGVLETNHPFLNTQPYMQCLPLLETLMPPIADEIYEDELLTEDAPMTFFMTRIGNKIGILTNCGYSDIIYDSYEANNDKCTFRLIRNDRKRARRADYWHPDGKGLPGNLLRRKSFR